MSGNVSRFPATNYTSSPHYASHDIKKDHMERNWRTSASSSSTSQARPFAHAQTYGRAKTDSSAPQSLEDRVGAPKKDLFQEALNGWDISYTAFNQTLQAPVPRNISGYTNTAHALSKMNFSTQTWGAELALDYKITPSKLEILKDFEPSKLALLCICLLSYKTYINRNIEESKPFLASFCNGHHESLFNYIKVLIDGHPSLIAYKRALQDFKDGKTTTEPAKLECHVLIDALKLVQSMP